MLYFSRWKALGTLLTALFICLFAIPNFFSDKTVQSWPKWAQRHLVLGLDLKGGSHILLEVDTNAVRKEKLDTLRDDVRRVVRENRLGSPAAATIRGSTVEFRVREGVDPQVALTKLRDLSQPLGGILSATGQRSVDVVDAGAPSDGSAVAGAANCTMHVYRGGSYADAAPALRVANRRRAASALRDYSIGFRVAKERAFVGREAGGAVAVGDDRELPDIDEGEDRLPERADRIVEDHAVIDGLQDTRADGDDPQPEHPGHQHRQDEEDVAGMADERRRRERGIERHVHGRRPSDLRLRHRHASALPTRHRNRRPGSPYRAPAITTCRRRLPNEACSASCRGCFRPLP